MSHTQSGDTGEEEEEEDNERVMTRLFVGSFNVTRSLFLLTRFDLLAFASVAARRLRFRGEDEAASTTVPSFPPL